MTKICRKKTAISCSNGITGGRERWHCHHAVLRLLLLTLLLCCAFVGAEGDVVTGSHSDTTSNIESDHHDENLKRVAKRLMEATLLSGSSPSFDKQQQQVENDWRVLLGALLENEDDVESMIKDIKQSTAVINRHVKGLLSIIYNDTDCMEREFDVSSSNQFRVEEVIAVFVKCRIVVLRNVFSMNNTNNAFQQYVKDVDTGRILEEGTTTFGGDHGYILAEDKDRFNYMLTRELVEQSPEIFANENVIRILSSPLILGNEFTLNHGGIINSWPSVRAKPQYWHIDGDYVHGHDDDDDDDAHNTHAYAHAHTNKPVTVGGHDMPPFAINMFTPLINMTMAHGPTEFRVGTSWLRGLDLNDLSRDDSQHDVDPVVQQLIDFEKSWQQHGRPPRSCPLSRRPLLNMGDIVLFDYMMTHRGGPNVNRDAGELRSLMFAMYSRKWFRDTTFDSGGGRSDAEDDCEEHDSECELYYLTRLARFAVVERRNDDASSSWDEL